MKSKRSTACDISKQVKDAVWERDGERCIRCGTHYAMPNAHYIPRSKGGLGIEENIVTLCSECHFLFDETLQRNEISAYIEAYLRSKYPGWDKTKLIYRK